MDTIRRQNLRALLEQWGGSIGMAKKLGHANPSYISQLLSGHRPITEKTARTIEKKLNLTLGWMDNDHTEEVTLPTPVAVDTELFASVVAQINALMRESNVRLSIGKYEELVTLIYEDATSHNNTINNALILRALRLAR